MIERSRTAHFKRAVDPIRRALRRAIGAPGGQPYQATIAALRADIAQLEVDVLTVAEDAAVADDRMADLLEELTSAIADSATERDALAAEMKRLEQRIADLEAALNVINADLGQRLTDARGDPG